MLFSCRGSDVFVLKVDDDAFVILAELEARLRFHMYRSWFEHPTGILSGLDPLIYWGYLVKNQFMGGELYGLSWSLVAWVGQDPVVATMTYGKEDKQVAKWIRHHPYASQVAWISETCWIYDHPRSGTVYAHGFLFPSEVKRIQENMFSEEAPTRPHSYSRLSVLGKRPSKTSWSYSSVSTFGLRYTPPLPNLTTAETAEALVEGSEMSLVRPGYGLSRQAWELRPTRSIRYEHNRIGGTVAVHYVKKAIWYLETAYAVFAADIP